MLLMGKSTISTGPFSIANFVCLPEGADQQILCQSNTNNAFFVVATCHLFVMCHVPVIWGVVVVWFVIWACHFSLTCLSVNVLFC